MASIQKDVCQGYKAKLKEGREAEAEFMDNFRAGLRSGQIRADEFSIRGLAEGLVEDGREWVASLDPAHESLVEANVVNTAAFKNITGQIIYSEVMAAFEMPAFIGSGLVRTISTRLSGEKIPGVTRLGDMAESVGEASPYPTAGFGEEWTDTPATTKRGFIVPVTKEAIFFDRTNLVLERARQVGEWLGVNKEKRILDTVLGITTSYRRNGGAAQATYGDSPWDNLSASTPLVDWKSIETAELLFDAMTDPNTGEPISIMPNTIVVPTGLRRTAELIVGASSVARVTPGYATSGNPTYATSGNPVSGYRVVTSPWVKNRTLSATTWFIGDFQKAFAYMENWPITVVQAPANSPAEFERDIVAQFKASERGAVAVMEPRQVVKCTA